MFFHSLCGSLHLLITTPLPPWPPQVCFLCYTLDLNVQFPNLDVDEKVTLNTYTRVRQIEVLGNPHKTGNSSLGSGSWKRSQRGRGPEFRHFTGSKLGPGEHRWGLGSTACLCLRVQTRPLPPGSPPCWLAVSPKSAPWAGRGLGRGTLIAFTQARVCQLWVKARHFARAVLEIWPTPRPELPCSSSAWGLRWPPTLSSLAGAQRCGASGIQAGSGRPA